MSERLRSLMVAHGALVFLLGMAAGFPFAFVILGKVVLWPFPGVAEWTGPGDLRGWRMAHLEGILNGLMLIGVAAVAPRLSLGTRAQAVVGWSLIVTAWGNIIASLVGPLFGGRGLEFGGGVANSLMYVLFVVAVVAVIVAMVLVSVGAFRRARASGG
jgi:hypothetical protein